MEKMRGKGLVASDDGKARAILVAKWKSTLATGNVVAIQPPKVSSFFFFLIFGDGFSGRHLVAKMTVFFFILIVGDGF